MAVVVTIQPAAQSSANSVEGRMKVQTLCTLGPASLSAEMVRRLDQAGVDLFRINLSHTPIDLVEAAIDIVQGASSKPLCLDLHGRRSVAGTSTLAWCWRRVSISGLRPPRSRELQVASQKRCKRLGVQAPR
jgi:hypothetical protein